MSQTSLPTPRPSVSTDAEREIVISARDVSVAFGKNVILASRVAGKACGGEILVSSLLRQLVESSVDPATFAIGREVELKGLAGTHTVYAVALA